MNPSRVGKICLMVEEERYGGFGRNGPVERLNEEKASKNGRVPTVRAFCVRPDSEEPSPQGWMVG